VPAKPAPSVLTDELRRFNAAAARRFGVAPSVHPKDFMYWFLHTLPTLPTAEKVVDYYFEDGHSSSKKLADLIAVLGYKDRVRLLEFASGYGMVSRHLKGDSRVVLTSCDIHEEALVFLKDELGIDTLASHKVPEKFAPTDKFDIVFVLSLFSHLPRATFGRWLRSLFSSLNSPGYLVFTTHGTATYKLTATPIPSDGFVFQPGSEQKDIDPDDYGATMTTPDFVIGEIYRQVSAPIVAYKHAYWWGHQDLWVVKRP